MYVILPMEMCRLVVAILHLDYLKEVVKKKSIFLAQDQDLVVNLEEFQFLLGWELPLSALQLALYYHQ